MGSPKADGPSGALRRAVCPLTTGADKARRSIHARASQRATIERKTPDETTWFAGVFFVSGRRPTNKRRRHMEGEAKAAAVWVPIREAARITGLSASTLYAWGRTGVLPRGTVTYAGPSGRAVRVHRQRLLDWMDSQAQG